MNSEGVVPLENWSACVFSLPPRLSTRLDPYYASRCPPVGLPTPLGLSQPRPAAAVPRLARHHISSNSPSPATTASRRLQAASIPRTRGWTTIQDAELRAFASGGRREKSDWSAFANARGRSVRGCRARLSGLVSGVVENKIVPLVRGWTDAQAAELVAFARTGTSQKELVDWALERGRNGGTVIMLRSFVGGLEEGGLTFHADAAALDNSEAHNHPKLSGEPKRDETDCAEHEKSDGIAGGSETSATGSSRNEEIAQELLSSRYSKRQKLTANAAKGSATREGPLSIVTSRSELTRPSQLPSPRRPSLPKTTPSSSHFTKSAAQLTRLSRAAGSRNATRLRCNRASNSASPLGSSHKTSLTLPCSLHSQSLRQQQPSTAQPNILSNINNLATGATPRIALNAAQLRRALQSTVQRAGATEQNGSWEKALAGIRRFVERA